ncbi:hypothetical protein KY320_01215 [Candidatus Woesearchaeota archaeon]|nr:hypothetical protein [Candidatus Woesearchaeota archaeon]
MRLNDEDIAKIIKAVKKEPLTVQAVSQIIGKSWVTTDKYLDYIKDKTGLINIKTFRKGTQAALKIVYYETREAKLGDDIKDNLMQKIQHLTHKNQFDFMDAFQFVDSSKKKSSFEHYSSKASITDQRLFELLDKVQRSLFVFSGNLSFLSLQHNNRSVANVLEELVEKKVFVKILMRVTVSSLSNIKKIEHLLIEHPEFIEIRHRWQPLRGFLMDDNIARFKNEEHLQDYRQGELASNARIFYEVYDKQWITWLERVFWSMYNTSITYNRRIKEIENLIN